MMRVFAYCAKSFVESARKAAGCDPMTCPPYDYLSFDPKWLEGNDFLYFDFHGDPGGDSWYEEISNGLMGLPLKTTALTADQLKQVDLSDTVVFALTCHLGDQDSPMLEALLRAGVTYVIGGDGLNWGSKTKLFGAPQLAYLYRAAMQLGFDPLKALSYAKKAFRLWLEVDEPDTETQLEAARDTLAFKAYYRA